MIALYILLGVLCVILALFVVMSALYIFIFVRFAHSRLYV